MDEKLLKAVVLSFRHYLPFRQEGTRVGELEDTLMENIKKEYPKFDVEFFKRMVRSKK